MFKIIQRRYWYFLLSALIIIPGLISIALNGIPLSIDFKGGTIYEMEFAADTEVSEEVIREVYLNLETSDEKQEEITEVQVVRAVTAPGEPLRFQVSSGEITPDAKTLLSAALVEAIGEVEDLRFESVGASVGEQVTRNAAIAVLLASVAVALYLTVMFRHLAHPVRYGVCTIFALIHDVLLTLGIASIVGVLLGWEVDALFLTALLTVIGFSVHDSVVVFDRIRENSGRMRGAPYESVVNHSVIQTLDRSINTQLTAIFTLVAIFVFSDGQLQRFLFWLIIGIISGTYSSIFVASPLLVVWEKREWENWFGRGKSTPDVA